ncbi:MAG: FHA protein [uncultured bacterium]|nr:MAG: FHA protein [uncultured bacterium]
MIDPFLLEVVVCPQCGETLRFTKEGVLVCLPCRVFFPVDKGVPDLRASCALPIKSKTSDRTQSKIIIEATHANNLSHIHLTPHTCRVVGRSSFEESNTQVLYQEGMLPLDDQVKKIVTNFIKKQGLEIKKQVEGSYAGFERLADFVINDMGISRLHAMIFFDGIHLGILDLVSRNGTFLNGCEIESAYVNEGDEILLGQSILKIRKD